MTNAWRIAERLMCAGVMPIFRERNNEEKAKKPASWQATTDENFASDTAYETGSSDEIIPLGQSPDDKTLPACLPAEAIDYACERARKDVLKQGDCVGTCQNTRLIPVIM
uniref:Integrase n=1 Tax=Haemonchus contortus TaxID=6289 RepID=A0A7I4YFW6_HAECO